MHLDVPAAESSGEDFLAKVLVACFAQHVDQEITVKDIDPHACQAITSAAVDSLRVDPAGIHAYEVEIRIGLRLLKESHDTSRLVDAHNAQSTSRFMRYRNRRDRDFRS